MIWALFMALAAAGPVADGAAAFDDGRLDDALTAWQAGADEGRPSGVLLFDLGNAWYRKGDLPRAIASYRGAQRLRPRDGDVHHNLALARAELGPVPPPVTAGKFWMAVLTPGELALLGALLTGLGSALLVGHRLRRGVTTRLPGLALWGGGLVVVWLAAGGAGELTGHPVVVVVDDDAVVRDAASVAAGERHRLRPGTELRVERTYGGFLLVEDSLGRRGWIAEGTARGH